MVHMPHVESGWKPALKKKKISVKDWKLDILPNILPGKLLPFHKLNTLKTDFYPENHFLETDTLVLYSRGKSH